MLILEKNYTIRTYCRTYFDNQTVHLFNYISKIIKNNYICTLNFVS